MLRPQTWIKFMRHGEIRVGKYIGANGRGYAVVKIDRSPFEIEVDFTDIIGEIKP